MDLAEIRTQIDEVDDQIIDLLVKRSQLAKKAFEVKKQNGKLLHLIPSREERVFDRTSHIAKSKLGISVPNVFAEIVSVCRHLEKQTEILILKSQLDNAEIAITKRFGQFVNISVVATLEEFVEKLSLGYLLGFVVQSSTECDEILKHENLSMIGEYNYVSLLRNAEPVAYSFVYKC